jgi:hypothetical protein
MWGDDLTIDEDAGLAYVAAHEQNTIERIALESGVRQNVAGEPLNPDMIGPTAGAWGSRHRRGRQSGIFFDRRWHQSPFSGVVREPKVLRVEFPAVCCLP